MSPLAAILSQMACEAAWWRASVVRMKSSAEMLKVSTIARKRGTLRSSSSGGVRPAFCAVWSILMPCSSVPVTKCTR